jgi:hypothetical protein
MSRAESLHRALKQLVDARMAAQGKRVGGIPAELRPSSVQFGRPAGGDDFDLGGVQDISIPGGSGLTGSVDIAGIEGLGTSQSGQEIRLAPPRIRHYANPRTPLGCSAFAALALRTIYLHPLELPGAMQMSAYYVRVQRVGNPDNMQNTLEAAIYARNTANDGFTLEAHFGTARFNDLAQLSTGTVYRRALAQSVLLPMGQHFLAILYKYIAPGSYNFGVCSSADGHYPGAGLYLSNLANSLPESIADNDLSARTPSIVWAELAAD